MKDQPTLNHTTMAEDFIHVADRLRSAALDQNEAELRALLSNNVNLIIAGLKVAGMRTSTLPETRECPDPYAPSTRFRCEQGHGVWRRDQLPIRRGSLACPVGFPHGCICGLKMEQSA